MFEETGIYIVNTPIGYSGANIFNNYFENLRFGIYGNGIASARITNNEMLYNKIWTLMQGKLHAGIWLDYSDDVQIYTNLVEYNSIEAAAVPAGATIAQDVRGLILKSVTNSKVISNVIKQTGRPIRCVDNMLLTKFYCNTYDGCFAGLVTINNWKMIGKKCLIMF
ncbi:MAG: right-handed parallel beta-helix repeat-containing protein [Bacteroidetes bacterium]|nr:right-handed parallel beta-helix repeat-containing protein [Bacteroidota bacterium]